MWGSGGNGASASGAAHNCGGGRGAEARRLYRLISVNLRGGTKVLRPLPGSGLNTFVPPRRLTDISLYRRRASAPLPPPQLWAAPEAEVPLPPGPHIGVLGEQCPHPEIRAHHGA